MARERHFSIKRYSTDCKLFSIVPLVTGIIVVMLRILENPCYRAESAPYVSSLLETAQFLKLTNQSLIRYGDGEFSLIQGRSLKFQNADSALSASLLSLLSGSYSDIMIALPDIFRGIPSYNPYATDWWRRHDKYRRLCLRYVHPETQYLNAMISSPATHIHPSQRKQLINIFDCLRDIWRGKTVVILRGNNTQVYQYDVYDTAQSQTILYAPRYQAWSEFSRLRHELLMQDSSALYILAAGPVSKPLVYELVQAGRRALDLGHLAKDYDAYRNSSRYTGHFFID